MGPTHIHLKMMRRISENDEKDEKYFALRAPQCRHGIELAGGRLLHEVCGRRAQETGQPNTTVEWRDDETGVVLRAFSNVANGMFVHAPEYFKQEELVETPCGIHTSTMECVKEEGLQLSKMLERAGNLRRRCDSEKVRAWEED